MALDDDLSGLDGAEPAGPVPSVPGAAAVQAPPRRGPGRPPVQPAGKKSGAQRRKEAKERAAAAVHRDPPPAPSSAAASPPPKPAKEVDDAGLKMARAVVDDPSLLSWIEGLYRMPFELWATAVKVPEVVPTDEKIARTAKLIKKGIELFGIREWMKWLPLVFLLVAVGEDVAHGIGAMQAAKARKRGAAPPEERRRQGREDLPAPAAPERPGPPPVVDAPVVVQPSFPGMPTPVFGRPSTGPLPPGDPA